MTPNSYTRAVNLLELCPLFQRVGLPYTGSTSPSLGSENAPSVIYYDSFSKLWKEELCNREIRRRVSLFEEQRLTERERERERQRRRRVEMSAAKERERGRLRRRREQTGEEERDRNRERLRRGREREATTSDRVYLGPMTSVCQHCQALRFPSELS